MKNPIKTLHQKAKDCGGCARRREMMRQAANPLVSALKRKFPKPKR